MNYQPRYISDLLSDEQFTPYPPQMDEETIRMLMAQQVAQPTTVQQILQMLNKRNPQKPPVAPTSSLGTRG